MAVIYVEQGDILKIEHINPPVLVVSKNFFNMSGEIIGCPIINKSPAGPLHLLISTSEIDGFVNCEKMTLLDLSVRGFSKIDTIGMADIINISDAIQGIFDYF